MTGNNVTYTYDGTLADLQWNQSGNLAQVNSYSIVGQMYDHSRFLYWTEDNRLTAVVDHKHFSYYGYDHTGERTISTCTAKGFTIDGDANLFHNSARSIYSQMKPSALYDDAIRLAGTIDDNFCAIVTRFDKSLKVSLWDISMYLTENEFSNIHRDLVFENAKIAISNRRQGFLSEKY